MVNYQALPARTTKKADTKRDLERKHKGLAKFCKGSEESLELMQFGFEEGVRITYKSLNNTKTDKELINRFMAIYMFILSKDRERERANQLLKDKLRKNSKESKVEHPNEIPKLKAKPRTKRVIAVKIQSKNKSKDKQDELPFTQEDFEKNYITFDG